MQGDIQICISVPLMAAFMRFRNTCFSKPLKMAAPFLIMFSWLLFTSSLFQKLFFTDET